MDIHCMHQMRCVGVHEAWRCALQESAKLTLSMDILCAHS